MREQGAGLEQTGAAGGPLVREVERVCGRHRRPQSRRRVAVKAEVPWAAKVPRGLEHKPASLKVIAASAKRAAVAERDEGLTAFPIWAGRERQRPGGDKSIAGRQPGDTYFSITNSVTSHGTVSRPRNLA